MSENVILSEQRRYIEPSRLGAGSYKSWLIFTREKKFHGTCYSRKRGLTDRR